MIYVLPATMFPVPSPDHLTTKTTHPPVPLLVPPSFLFSCWCVDLVCANPRSCLRLTGSVYHSILLTFLFLDFRLPSFRCLFARSAGSESFYTPTDYCPTDRTATLGTQ